MNWNDAQSQMWTPGEVQSGAHYKPPTQEVRVTEAQAQQIMDQLWKMGVRPTKLVMLRETWKEIEPYIRQLKSG